MRSRVGGTFRELVASDIRRQSDPRDTTFAKLTRCVSAPVLASVVVRAQQCAFDNGHARAAAVLRTVGIMVAGIDVHPGPQIGRGFRLVDPSGVTFGSDLRVGDDVTFEAGVTCAVRLPDALLEQEVATIGDRATLGANAVLVGGVRIGNDAHVLPGSVVLSDVADGAVVHGVPARPVVTAAPDGAVG